MPQGRGTARQMLTDGDVTRSPDLARTMALRVIELKPQAFCQAIQGGIDYRQARYEEAVAALRSAAEQKPGETSALAGFFLAMSYHYLGEHDLAQSACRRAERSWKEAIDIPQGKGIASRSPVARGQSTARRWRDRRLAQLTD